MDKQGMMPGLRVQWVTRRFWPIVSDSVWHTLALAESMRQQGRVVEIVSAAWHSSWPAEVVLREMKIRRIDPSPTTPFRSRRFARSLLEYLDSTVEGSQKAPGILITEAAEEDALVLVDHFRNSRPVLVHYDCIDGLGPLSTRLRTRAIDACAKATEVIVSHDYARRELISAGIDAGRVKILASLPAPVIDRSAGARSAARRALADINHELFLRAEDRLIVCLSELTKSAGVEFIVQAIGPLIENKRGMKLWIVGDGPERMRLYEIIKRQGWRHDIAMPGSFEDPDTVLAAADLCIIPSPQQGSRWLMPTALANRLPTLICAGPTVTARLGNAAQPLLFETGAAARLQKLFARWLEEPACFTEVVAQLSGEIMQRQHRE